MASSDDIQRAAAAAVATDACQAMLLKWLEIAGAHLGESGLVCAAPALTHAGESLSSGCFSSAVAEVADPSTGQVLQLQSVLFAQSIAPGFGSTQGALEVFFIEKDADGKAVKYHSLLRHTLFSTLAFEGPCVTDLDTDSLVKLLSARIDEGTTEAFRMGIGPHLHRFRLALEEALAP